MAGDVNPVKYHATLSRLQEQQTMDNLDNRWSFMQQTDIDMGAQLHFEESEEDTFSPLSEEASSSSSEFTDSSVHLKESKACTKLLRAPASTAKRVSPLCSPKSSCLGKRERDHQLAGAKEKGAGVKESKWAVQLLNSCAEAIGNNNIQRTQHFMWVLNDLGSLSGDANQRLAAYGLKALFGKVAGTVAAASTYHPIVETVSLTASPKSLQNTLLKFHDVHPWHQMVYTVSNGVLMDTLEGRDVIHVIDIGVSQGTHWPTFIEALATRPSGPPSVLKLTLVEDEASVSSMNSALEVKNRLERFAKVMGLNLDLRVFASSQTSLTRDSFQLSEGEALAVCVHFRFSKLYEMDGERDKFLKFLRCELKPELVILGDNDSDNTSTDFATVAREVVDHFWKFLDSMNSAFKSEDSQERQTIEHLLAMGMINNLAAGLEKNEAHSSWNLRMSRAGFVPQAPHDEVTETVRMLVKKNDPNWDVRNEENSLVLLWKHQPATFCSVWKV